MKKWNNAELVSIEINATANGNDDWDMEAMKYIKNYYPNGDDLRENVGPKAKSGDSVVVTDAQS